MMHFCDLSNSASLLAVSLRTVRQMSGIFLPLMSGFADAEVTANIFKSLSKHPRANLKAVVLSSIQTKRGNKVNNVK